jgi:cell wall-associated NlpC family hydrolase
MRSVAVVALSAAAFLAASDAFASPPMAEVRDAEGALIAAARTTPFAYPADGSVLRIGGASATAHGLELRDVSLLNGRVSADRLLVPADGLAGSALEGLTVAGRSEPGTANALLSLGGSSYVVVLQQAVVPGSGAGVVGLRIYLGESRAGVPPGTQILVGLARAAVPKRQNPSHSWQLLGVSPPATPVETPNPFAGIADPFAALRTPSSVGVRAVAIAQQFLGVPYVWAGADPVTGFDCSGLVMFVYRQLGVGLPHFSGSQWYSGQRVPLDRLAPGDLVFFDLHRNGPGHVGIYIGEGKFIHSPHTGAVVRIATLSERAFSYVGAVRPY